MEKIENREICAKCGGYCCRKSGCDYFVSDLKATSLEYIEALLDTGRVSIIALLKFGRTPKGVITCTPILSLRSRNIGREAIDLLSFKTTCASLEENGCHFDLEHRPSGATAVIPDERVLQETEIDDSFERHCKSSADKLEELYKWDAHQKKLSRIVKRRTGKSVYTVLEEDAETLFYNSLNSNFDGVMEEELIAVEEMLPLLSEAYPEALERARARSQKGRLRVLSNYKKRTIK